MVWLSSSDRMPSISVSSNPVISIGASRTISSSNSSFSSSRFHEPFSPSRVDRQPQQPALVQGYVFGDHARHRCQAELLGGLDPHQPIDDIAGAIDQHRHREAPCGDRIGHVIDVSRPAERGRCVRVLLAILDRDRRCAVWARDRCGAAVPWMPPRPSRHVPLAASGLSPTGQGEAYRQTRGSRGGIIYEANCKADIEILFCTQIRLVQIDHRKPGLRNLQTHEQRHPTSPSKAG